MFSLKSKSFTTDFPCGKLRGIPNDFCKSSSAFRKLHYSCSDVNLFEVQGDLIPMVMHRCLSWGALQKEDIGEELCQGNKADTPPWDLYCHFTNTNVMKCSLHNVFPCSMQETEQKKWAPSTFISRTSCYFVKASRNNNSMNNSPSAPLQHEHIHMQK